MSVEKTDFGRFVDREGGIEKEQTIHFDVGNIGGLSVAGTPGSFDVSAASVFGQLNIQKDVTIEVVHLHLIEGVATSGDLSVEIWRRRDGTMTLLDTLSTSNPSDFTTVGGVPAGDLKELKAGDYLFCQAIAGSAVSDGADGLTIDVHFEEKVY